MHFVDQVQFGPARLGESFGRWPEPTGELYPMSALTLGGPNSGPRVGPVIISEVMYHPREVGQVVDPSDLEYLEVYNPSGGVGRSDELAAYRRRSVSIHGGNHARAIPNHCRHAV